MGDRDETYSRSYRPWRIHGWLLLRRSYPWQPMSGQSVPRLSPACCENLSKRRFVFFTVFGFSEIIFLVHCRPLGKVGIASCTDRAFLSSQSRSGILAVVVSNLSLAVFSHDASMETNKRLNFKVTELL
jgi:hypothetical protein